MKGPYRFTIRYTLFGVAFGFSFPLFSWIMDAVVFHNLDFTLQSIAYVHKVNPLHYIIDTAPFFLGLSFGYAGRKQDNISQINGDLEIEVQDRTSDLKVAIQKLEAFSQELEKKVDQRTEALTQANRIKDKMLSIISHDLRSPLTSLAGTLQLMQHGALQEEERSMLLSRVAVDVHYTNELLENLLSWASSKDSASGLRIEKFFLKSSVNNVIALFSSMASDKQIIINNCILEEHAVMADQNMINLVFRNLVSNALKFTQQGGEIYVSAEKTNGTVRVSVKDTGIGIASEKIDQLMNGAQSKMTTRGTSNEKGSGIGLLLCKEFIEKHNSTIAIESTPGNGSIFSFELPGAN
jgi:signal transduction histidine kinase